MSVTDLRELNRALERLAQQIERANASASEMRNARELFLAFLRGGTVDVEVQSSPSSPGSNP